MSTDPMWCFENYGEAAAYIDELEQQRDELLDLLSRYGVYAPDEVQDEINSAIAKVHP